ncbi:MAG TPA: TIGR02996 domain-containing protein [Fimbriiglobus sp.]|jgi:uncharacterized protein (TIGR02996 family)
MSDRDALTGAIVAAQSDDLPRLVFADYLEELGDESYARFIRGHVERARTAAWEPFAVRWDRGLIPGADPNAFRDRLPKVVDDWNVEWDLTAPFRRGFGSAVRVRDLYTFLDTAGALFDAAPVCELSLPTAPLDAWRRFANQTWLPRVTAVRFAGLSTPIEPIRCLCESPLATRLEDIYFDRANSPAMPELVAAIANSPLRQQLRGLHFRIGFESVQEMIQACGWEPWPKLENISFVTMGLTDFLLREMRDSGILEQLVELNLSDNPIGVRLFEFLRASQRLRSLTARKLTYEPFTLAGRTNQTLFPNLRQLDLTDTTGLDSAVVRVLGEWFPGLKSLSLAHTNLSDVAVGQLLDGPLWPQIVELDLTENRLDRSGIEKLLTCEIPENLAWIGLPDCQKNVDFGDSLRVKFADRNLS